jgi:hypothetical protein
MKKQILIALSLIPATLFAQQGKPVVEAKSSTAQTAQVGTQGTDNPTGTYVPGLSYSTELYKKHPGYASILIGKTFYDLQTNASVGRRIILHDNGTVSAVWTTSSIGEANWPTRGTGYNFKNTSWASPVSNRFENERTGWPAIGVLESAGNKYELVMGHVSTTGGWVVSKNNAVGSSSFTKLNTSLLQQNNKVAIWGRIGTNGKQTIHQISNYFASTADGIPVVKLNGVSSPTTYSRSTDGGVTWDKQFVTLPGYDSTRIVAGGGDNYAIDVKDSIVAIVIGGTGEDVAIYKSTNSGNSFTRIVAEEFPYSPFTKKFIANADRQKTADGSFDVLIGNDNKVHVFWGKTFVSDEDITDDSYSFYPGTAQLMHWAEGMDTAVVCGVAKDYDADGALTIQQETYSALDANGNLPSGVTSATRYGSTALVSFPTSAQDANGNLYVVYSAPHELAISPFNANYRDLYVSYSKDGGLTWTMGQNITANAYGVLNNTENVFASCAKRADNFLHLIYQEDDLPGTNLQNNGNSNAHPNNEQRIMYRAIPVSDILSNTIGDVASTKKVTYDPKIFFVSQNMPNPASSTTEAYIYMRDGSDITLTVSDITGKVLKTENLGFYGAGNSTISINVDGLSSGIYLYTISNNAYSITKKMQVK